MAKKNTTGNFSKVTRYELALRVRCRCSNPECWVQTISLKNDRSILINGEAAHIVAKSSDGPRGNSQMTPEQLSDISNGIWLCANCHNEVDNNRHKYSVELLNQWKKCTEDLFVIDLNDVRTNILTTVKESSDMNKEFRNIPDLIKIMASYCIIRNENITISLDYENLNYEEYISFYNFITSTCYEEWLNQYNIKNLVDISGYCYSTDWDAQELMKNFVKNLKSDFSNSNSSLLITKTNTTLEVRLDKVKKIISPIEQQDLKKLFEILEETG